MSIVLNLRKFALAVAIFGCLLGLGFCLVMWVLLAQLEVKPQAEPITKSSFLQPLLDTYPTLVATIAPTTSIPSPTTPTPTLAPTTIPVRQLTPAQPQSKTIVFPEIADSDVLEVLNQYRSDHQVHQLIEDQRLCQYAQKRVGDLVSLGKLDGHEGFKQDFASLESLPESIKNYSGGKIGENLAYQYCRNMTTGESFIAQSGAALIEWCFDSSTAGHREAQLNPNFNAVCVRHAQGFFVVIFGE